MTFFYYFKKAFTLAEVLITLLIVGVVAGITIPTVINDTQEKEFQTAYKKKFAEFNQAFSLMRMENGGTLAGYFKSGDLSSFEQPFRKYLNIKSFSISQSIAPASDWHDYGIYKELDGTSGGQICAGCPSATFADGSFFMTKLSWSSNELSKCDIIAGNTREGLCFVLLMDVNGRKGPNVMGKDIYMIDIYKDKTIPADWTGSYGAVTEASCSTSGSGDGCAIKYLK